MYARVSTFQFRPEKLDEVIRIANESIEPELRQEPGLKSRLRLLDRRTGKAILISLFETQADMKAGLSSGLVQQLGTKVDHLLTGKPVTEFYEVAE
jgi:quinol monooxygenase YgiN